MSPRLAIAVALALVCASEVRAQSSYLTSSDLPVYARALRDRDPTVRREAAEGLQLLRRSYGTDRTREEDKLWTDATRVLIGALKDPDLEVRRLALQALAESGYRDKGIVEPALVEALKDPDSIVRKNAAAALQNVNRSKTANSALLIALKDQDVGVRLEAARVFYCGGSAVMVIPAGSGLPPISPEIAASVSTLSSLLRERNPVIRIQAADVFRCVNFRAGIATPVLVRALQDPDKNVLRHVLGSLSNIVRTFSSIQGSDPLKQAFRDTMEPSLQAAMPSLLTFLKGRDPVMRSHALDIVTSMTGDTKQALPLLLGLLGNQDASVRRSVISALGNIGQSGDGSADRLLAIELHDPDDTVRIAAVGALERLHAQSFPALIAALRSADPTVRRNAANTLCWAAPKGEQAVPALAAALKDSDSAVRFQAIDALSRIGSKVQNRHLFASIVPEVTSALHDSNPLVRQRATGVIGYAKVGAKSAVPSLILMLHDSDPFVRNNAAIALGKLGVASRAALPALVDMVTSPNTKSSDATLAASALVKIAASSRDSQATEMIYPLTQAAIALDRAKFPDEAKQVKTAVDVLKAVRRGNWFEFLLAIVAKYPWLIIPIAWCTLWILCRITLKYAPLWIWEINEAISFHLRDTKVKLVETPAKKLLVIGFFHYHEKVLDAWVLKHLDSVRARFEALPTVDRNRDPIPGLPVRVGKNDLSEGLRATDLKDAFNRQRSYILIHGEGGSGKTTIACQIAEWVMSKDEKERPYKKPMLPVLIEQNLRDGAQSDQSALEVMRGKLGALLGDQNEPPVELVKILLRTKRILIIVDGLSEMNDASRRCIKPDSPEFDANALVVTSRFDDDLTEVSPKTLICPLRIPVERLTYFIKSYLAAHDALNSFEEGELLDAPIELRRIVDGKPITVLLAKLYAQRMIDRKFGHESTMPGNIPELMIGYLNYLNRPLLGERSPGIENREVQRIAKIVAWECVRGTLHPGPASYASISKVLRTDKAGQEIKYLNERLRLLRVAGEGEERVSFTLDPLAEYLAALWLVERFKSESKPWLDFLATAEKASPRAARSFLLALRDCCVSKGAEYGVPSFVTEKLERLLNPKNEEVSAES